MKKIFIVTFLSLLFSVMFIVSLDNDNYSLELNPNYFYKSGFENSLNLNIYQNGDKNIISPNGEWNYKNPVGLFSNQDFISNTAPNIIIEKSTEFESSFDLIPDYCKFDLVINDVTTSYTSFDELLSTIINNGDYEISITASWN